MHGPGSANQRELSLAWINSRANFGLVLSRDRDPMPTRFPQHLGLSLGREVSSIASMDNAPCWRNAGFPLQHAVSWGDFGIQYVRLSRPQTRNPQSPLLRDADVPARRLGVMLYEICWSPVHTPSHLLPVLGPSPGSLTPLTTDMYLRIIPNRIATLPLNSHRWCWWVALEPHDISSEDCSVHPLPAFP